MFWKLLWLLFLLAVIGYGVWSLLVLLQQKRAWKAFATKYGLKYMDNGFFSPPGFWGEIKGRKILGYVNVVSHADKAKSGNWTFFDVVFQNPLDENILICGDAKLFDTLNGEVSEYRRFVPNDLNWGDKHPLVTDDPDFFRSYLNRENVKPLLALKKLKSEKSGFNFLLQQDDSFATFYSRSIFDSPKEINNIIKILMDVADAWEKESKGNRILVDDLPGKTNLKFEEDEDAALNEAGVKKDDVKSVADTDDKDAPSPLDNKDDDKPETI